MDREVVVLSIFLFIFFGWVPILAIGKAVSMIIKASKANICCKNNCKEDMGCQLIESWRIPNLSLEQVYDKQDNLNSQGWYTVIHNPNENKPDEFEIIVYVKNE